MTHTLAELEVPFDVFVEILKLLDAAGYDHAIDCNDEGHPVAIDMTGIQLSHDTTTKHLAQTRRLALQDIHSANAILDAAQKRDSHAAYVVSRRKVN